MAVVNLGDPAIIHKNRLVAGVIELREAAGKITDLATLIDDGVNAAAGITWIVTGGDLPGGVMTIEVDGRPHAKGDLALTVDTEGLFG